MAFEDWCVVDFYQAVQDQVVNQTPMGTKSGDVVLTLRLEALEAACRLLDVPVDARAWIVDMARWFHHVVREKLTDSAILRCPPSDLDPPEVPDGA